jgi:hypothetical protein
MSNLTVFAKEVQLPQCDNKSTCVNDKNFYVEVKRVVRRGDVIVIQLQYVGKTYNPYYFKFTYNSFEGYATILDAEGNEFKISGKEISDFTLKEGQKKIISFKFRSDKQKKIVEPFDLTIKTQDDEITLFDLKQESRFRQGVSSSVKQ